jgi:hypothetical protein
MVPGNDLRPMSGTLFAISVSLIMFWAAAEGNFLASDPRGYALTCDLPYICIKRDYCKTSKRSAL